MITNNLPFGWVFTANLMAMVAFILSLYVLILSPKRYTNQAVSFAILLQAVSSFLIAQITKADFLSQARLPMVLSAMLIPATVPALWLAAIALVKPAWLEGRMRWVRYVLVLLVLVPASLVIINLVSRAGIYLTLPDSAHYRGGYPGLMGIASGRFGQEIVFIYQFVLNILLLVSLFFFSFVDRKLPVEAQRNARLLFIVHLIGFFASQVMRSSLPAGGIWVLAATLYTLVYALATLRNMLAVRVTRTGRLQPRLTALTLAVSIPVFIFIAYLLIGLVQDKAQKDAVIQIEKEADAQAVTLTHWLDTNTQTLQFMASLPEITSMDAVRQKPVLQAMQHTFPYFSLVSTTDSQGMNISRSDDEPARNYSDQGWFEDLLTGAPVSQRVFLDPTSGGPVMVVAVPIRNAGNQFVGAAMFSSPLVQLGQAFQTIEMGETGYTYIVDNINRLVFHPNLLPSAVALIDFSQAAPVAAYRSGDSSQVRFVDESGTEWVAVTVGMSNGWAVVTQQTQAEISASVTPLSRVSGFLVIFGSLIVLGLIWAAIYQAVQPISILTQAVQAIASGNLDRTALVETDDEIGMLAMAFNSMTAQQRELITGLERRVAERTIELETRSAQLQAAADVGHATANIRNLGELLSLVTRLINERFGFYHVGIFLLDDAKEYAVLRASNSPGGERMLRRNHKLKVGQQGIVGYVTGYREPRIALNVGEDAVYFNNPDLPETQSEMALPLIVSGELMGALDVQSTAAYAFSDQDVQTLQVLADQVATAIHSARLVQQTEELLETERRIYGEISHAAWLEMVESIQNPGYLRNSDGVMPLRLIVDDHIREAVKAGGAVVDPADPKFLYVPVPIRGSITGVLRLKRASGAGEWTDEELQMLSNLAIQVGQALDSARAYQQTRGRAQREHMLGEIESRVRETLDMDSILKTTSQEVRKALGLRKVIIRLGTPQPPHQEQDPGRNGGSQDEHTTPPGTEEENGGSNAST